MQFMDVLGLTAAFCTTISFLPQAIKVVKTKNTEALSLLMYSVFTVGVVLWLVYGILREDLAITLANFVTLILALVILGLKIKSEIAKTSKE